MLFEIINPSDKCTIVAPDLEIAGLACCLIGVGKYALQEIGGTNEVPLFLFGGQDEWFVDNFGVAFDEALDRALANRGHELAACLESTLVGDEKERDQFDALVASAKTDKEREDIVLKWNDEHRSSVNDICGRAQRFAANIRLRMGRSGE